MLSNPTPGAVNVTAMLWLRPASALQGGPEPVKLRPSYAAELPAGLPKYQSGSCGSGCPSRKVTPCTSLMVLLAQTTVSPAFT